VRSRTRPAGGTTATGARAEEAALGFLRAHGLHLVARNFRCRAGELDLVMLEGRELVVVEVRYRRTAAWVEPAATVTAAKRRHLLQATARFLQARPAFANHALRFDVLALSGEPSAPACDWIRRAFDASDAW